MRNSEYRMNRYPSKTIICLFIIAAVLAVYGQVRNHEFINYDDPFFVTDNSHVQAGLTLESVIWAFTSRDGICNPLSWLSHMLDCELFGLWPGGHHLTSLFFHTANALLLFLVLKRMTGALWRSAAVALLFALHPLNVESVAWVAERRNVLSTLFWLLTIWAYASYAGRPSMIRYLAVVLCLVLGLMSKPMLVTVPFFLFLLDYWPLGRICPGQFPSPLSTPTQPPPSRGRRSEEILKSTKFGGEGQSRGYRPMAVVHGLILEKVPLLMFSVISAGLTFFVAQSQGSVASIETLPIRVRIANALVSSITYIVKMVWPRDLAVFYPHPGYGMPSWKIVGAAIILISISFLLIYKARSYPYLAVGWLWYLVTLAPVIGIVQAGSQAMADRFMYVPLIGLFIIVVWGASDLAARWRFGRVALAVSAGIVLLCLVICSRIQAGFWGSSVSLFEHALDSTTDNYEAHFCLGTALSEEGEVERAIGHYLEVLRIRPQYARAHDNLGNSLTAQGRLGEAISHYSEALRIDPDNDHAHNNLGSVLARLGRLNEAIPCFSEALRLNPDLAEAHNNLGNALSFKDRPDEAISHFLEALRLNPDYPKAHQGLGNAFVRMGRMDDAVSHYQEALRLNPDFLDAHNNLGNVLARQGRIDEAILHFSEALRVNPDYGEGHYNLGIALGQRGRTGEAIRHYSESLRINPDNAEAHYNLATTMGRQGRLDEAVTHFLEALRIKPDHAEAHLNLAITLQRQGKLDQAVTHCSEALRIRPDYGKAREVMRILTGESFPP
ncbi:MAG: tetratricopeptide repeat protein [Thermodesulfobacteriota bacterium]|nr:tetratricopeptide repeat protein [Thermodesulfobacteriota bacterium]